ncbi:MULTISPECIES: alpha/beta hydrolase family protein [Actinomadura]|uniref:Alpha/beta hydrolase family protein n=1 Tax=Actinomadura yumaensis TaxID=111807 RepID=A0ABW2CR03_9ACTN|nr:prolyl oligopeptidase family serine peptidase [Actinomadura sp. J1-007]MWK35423.1 prolyl oligopeptidase family serine peptidase [Actinomadura sp. J1-007]
MSGERPNQRDLDRDDLTRRDSPHAGPPPQPGVAPARHASARSAHGGAPVRGTAAGVGYFALPPTAVDARPNGPTRLIVAWPGFDPPRAAAALAAALPMTGVPVWRVFLELPAVPATAGMSASRAMSGGLGSSAFLEPSGIEAYGAVVEEAAARLPDVLAELRRTLALEEGPVGLAGFSAGGAAALLVLARGDVPVSTAALVAPVIAPSRVAAAVEKRAGRDRAWPDGARETAGRLDFGARAGELARRDAALLLIGGAKDRVVPPNEITAFRDALRRVGAPAVESATFRMGHALAAEPGTDACPPITEAVRVDGVLTDWFRERLAETTEPEPSAPAHTQPEQRPAPQTVAQGPFSLDLSGTPLEPAAHLHR